METFLWMALLSVMTGLTFVAYKHPVGYHRMFLWLAVPLAVFNFMSGFWGIARSVTMDAIKPFIIPGKFEEAAAAAKALQAPVWVTTLLAGCLAYLLFLALLPKILGVDEQRRD